MKNLKNYSEELAKAAVMAGLVSIENIENRLIKNEIVRNYWSSAVVILDTYNESIGVVIPSAPIVSFEHIDFSREMSLVSGLKPKSQKAFIDANNDALKFRLSLYNIPDKEEVLQYLIRNEELISQL